MIATLTMYRPDCVEETHGLIAETLDALLDMRIREEISNAIAVLPSWVFTARICDGVDLRTALRFLLPSAGCGEPVFRTRHGWSQEEIICVVRLLQCAATALRALVSVFGLEDVHLPDRIRDAKKVESLMGRWEALT